MAKMVKIQCPHCKNESERTPLSSINVDRNPEMRAKIQDLSCFRWRCPVCGATSLVMDPCLYHDLANQFMVWLRDDKPESADFDPLAGYTLRWTTDFNAFREKINILERGLDDRAVEVMKYLLLAQLKNDLDVVELLFHELNERQPSSGLSQYCPTVWSSIFPCPAKPIAKSRWTSRSGCLPLRGTLSKLIWNGHIRRSNFCMAR